MTATLSLPVRAAPSPITRLSLKLSRRFLRSLDGGSILEAETIGPLAPEQCLGSEHSYMRHIAYADPRGRYTVVYLVWRPGQASPVHGHRTWCAYRVLQGELMESHFQWDADCHRAQKTGGTTRKFGDIVQAPPGLQHIHCLANNGTQVAISLHVYGVDEASIATGVNHLVAVA
jgi:predicted metal-dependent enzyme (double-stranded beta helix superfamily)